MTGLGWCWRRSRYFLSVTTVAVITALPAEAQRVDYTTADRIRTFDPYLVGGRVYPVWLSDSVRFYYEAPGAGADRGTFYLVDPRVGTRRVVSDTASLVDRRSEGPP